METKDLLAHRAEQLANRISLQAEAETGDSVLTFFLNDECFAVRMADISNVLPFTKLTPLPIPDPKIVGVMAIKNEVHTVLNLARLLQLPSSYSGQTKDSSKGHVVVLRLSGHHLGFYVDRLGSIDSLEAQEVPNPAIDPSRSYVKLRATGPLILIENFLKLIDTPSNGDRQK